MRSLAALARLAARLGMTICRSAIVSAIGRPLAGYPEGEELLKAMSGMV